MKMGGSGVNPFSADEDCMKWMRTFVDAGKQGIDLTIGEDGDDVGAIDICCHDGTSLAPTQNSQTGPRHITSGAFKKTGNRCYEKEKNVTVQQGKEATTPLGNLKNTTRVPVAATQKAAPKPAAAACHPIDWDRWVAPKKEGGVAQDKNASSESVLLAGQSMWGNPVGLLERPRNRCTSSLTETRLTLENIVTLIN